MRSCLYVLCLQVSDGVTYLCLLSTLFHWCLRFFRRKRRNRRLGRHRTRIQPVNTLDHRLNMELDLQSLFELHVHSCTHWLRPLNHPPPAFGLIYEGSKIRRHLFVTPCIWCMVNWSSWNNSAALFRCCYITVKYATAASQNGFSTYKQGCESRRQTISSISRPTFREIWKVSSLSRSLPLLGKKVSPRSRPFGFSRPNPAENESSIANR